MTEADPAPAYQRAKALLDATGLFEAGLRPPATGEAREGDRLPPRRSSAEERELEHRAVLAELVEIHRLLGVPWEPEGKVPPRPTLAPGSASGGATADPGESSSRGAESPYLDDRLAAASEVADALSTEFEAIQQQTNRLGGSVATLREELGRASEELAFLRSGPGFDTQPSQRDRAPRADAPTVRPTKTSGRSGGPASATDSRPAYDSFTVSRYNETVGEVRRRRRWLFGSTLALATGISAVLVAVAYLAHEPMPPWWLAGLPLVWMIPVPFFLASFVGTHRMLSTHSLELPEAR
ncbi:MAG: hypothetical protein L3J96_04485 [Thermoplasmata archaeon]|nr:hypothetical protein [Thermoplasmata archaeon]